LRPRPAHSWVPLRVCLWAFVPLSPSTHSAFRTASDAPRRSPSSLRKEPPRPPAPRAVGAPQPHRNVFLGVVVLASLFPSPTQSQALRHLCPAKTAWPAADAWAASRGVVGGRPISPRPPLARPPPRPLFHFFFLLPFPKPAHNSIPRSGPERPPAGDRREKE